MNVVWTHFPLHPETPPEGVTLQELFAGRSVDVEAMQTRMRGLMQQEGLPYGHRTKTFNSRLAQELGKWAETRVPAVMIHEALFRAYFVEGKNIADLAVLIDIATQVGLPPAETREVLESRRFQQAVDADWQRARDCGITGVPTFVAEGRGVVGAQPYEVLERLVTLAGATPKEEAAS